MQDVDQLFRPPTHCPDCGTELRQPHLSPPRLARRLRWAALVATAVWIPAVWYFLALNPEVANRLGDRGHQVALAVPAIGLITWSMSLRRVLPLECYGCGWKKEIEP